MRMILIRTRMRRNNNDCGKNVGCAGVAKPMSALASCELISVDARSNLVTQERKSIGSGKCGCPRPCIHSMRVTPFLRRVSESSTSMECSDENEFSLRKGVTDGVWVGVGSGTHSEWLEGREVDRISTGNATAVASSVPEGYRRSPSNEGYVRSCKR